MGRLLLLLLALYLPVLSVAAPERVITLAPNLTEIVFALGEGDRIVGVTQYCQFPPEAKQKTQVGDLFNPSLERCLAQRADLLIHYPTQAKFAAQIKAAGVETLSVEVETIADIRDAVMTIGKALAVEEKATALEKSIADGLAELSADALDEKPRVLFVVGYSPAGLRDIYAAGHGNFLNEMIGVAGGENLLGPELGRYPTVSREFLVANPPDVILDCNESAGRGRTESERTEMRRAWLSLLGRADGQTRVVFSDDPHLTIPGPAVVDSVRRVKQLIRGDQEPEIPNADPGP